MRGGAAFEAMAPIFKLNRCSNDNVAASALALIVLPDISPRIVTGRKGWFPAFAKQKKAAPKRRLFHFVP
ncbi:MULTISPECIES: hypothetical protein [unclassified Mesorhizobium]|uniref:hypothetical protein n=1 Tax=unclassified Mesorhizobium TaxID=325217 RepID=UPI000F7516D7|nr:MULTISPECIES: hypothetical protein [unclassified Mesorhizobium]AZO03518.1 hypothetical protein EJ068_10745 [Mesorhizobium sp. M2A.F.Ca.ET.043.02.1.1]RUW41318.1 hypothetical protein EOA37_10650 [Mesorhizobium sp. M2A.F.Ca.ET.015.02.1.1]RUW80593.1 hypothetical protein EOA28_04295 [Mesorhizobium sp. M2A.F.Ca.ET.067.02.1.1]RVC93616.1 hypothetical protein EN739_20610 [Mesorhizobium sp. M2A.F.Ca.ET.017.03.2.1]RVD09815.1 hypothetical protein EN753_08775 [Mesorhizobium sp. M2A.F.Ca.ET.029.05.1.1]